jgi:hypothetical protein
MRSQHHGECIDEVPDPLHRVEARHRPDDRLARRDPVRRAASRDGVEGRRPEGVRRQGVGENLHRTVREAHARDGEVAHAVADRERVIRERRECAIGQLHVAWETARTSLAVMRDDLHHRGYAGQACRDPAERGGAEVGEMGDLDVATPDDLEQLHERRRAEARMVQELDREPFVAQLGAERTGAAQHAHRGLHLAPVQRAHQLDELTPAAVQRPIEVDVVAHDEHAHGRTVRRLHGVARRSARTVRRAPGRGTSRPSP